MDILTDNDSLSGALLTSRPLEFKLLGDALNSGMIEGYGATFHNVDHVDDTILPGAFADTIAQHHAAGSAPGMLWNHSSSRPVGRWTAMGEDARGLRVRGQLNLNTADGKKAHAHLLHGDLSGLSIGFQPAKNGQSYNNGVRTLSKVTLHEVSLTPIPADPHARITQVKNLASRRELEELLELAGLARGAARKVAAAGWPALAGEPDDTPDPRIAEFLKRIDARTAELKGL